MSKDSHFTGQQYVLIIPHSYIQLFHHQFYGHAFPVPNEHTKSEVHQIPSHPVMICRIELPHYLFFVTVLDGSPIEFSQSCMLR